MQRKKILVVDDEPMITRQIKKQLEATERFEVRAENSGQAAIDAAREFGPDAILLDVMMPDLDGSQVKFRITQIPALKNVPVIFLTALIKEGEKNTKDVFIPKPVDIAKIVECLDTQLGADRGE